MHCREINEFEIQYISLLNSSRNLSEYSRPCTLTGVADCSTVASNIALVLRSLTCSLFRALLNVPAIGVLG